jgi:hypothetical protein
MKYRKLKADEIVQNGDVICYPDGRRKEAGGTKGYTVASFGWFERPIKKPKRDKWHKIPFESWPKNGQTVIVRGRNGDYELADFDNSHRWQWETDYTHWCDIPKYRAD